METHINIDTQQIEDEVYRFHEFNFWRFQYSCRRFLLKMIYGFSLKDGKIESDRNNQVPRLDKYLHTDEFNSLLACMLPMLSSFKDYNNYDEIEFSRVPEQEEKKLKLELTMYYNYKLLQDNMKINQPKMTHLIFPSIHRNKNIFSSLKDKGPEISKAFSVIYDPLLSVAIEYGYHPYGLNFGLISASDMKKGIDEIRGRRNVNKSESAYQSALREYIANQQSGLDYYFYKADPFFSQNKANVVLLRSYLPKNKQLLAQIRELYSEEDFYKIILFEDSINNYIESFFSSGKKKDIVIINISINRDGQNIQKYMDSIKEAINSIKSCIQSNRIKWKHYLIDETGRLQKLADIHIDNVKNSDISLIIQGNDNLNFSNIKNYLENFFLMYNLQFNPHIVESNHLYYLKALKDVCPANNFRSCSLHRIIGLLAWDEIYRLPFIKLFSKDIGKAIKSGQLDSDTIKFIDDYRNKTTLANVMDNLLAKDNFPFKKDIRVVRRAYDNTYQSIFVGDVLPLIRNNPSPPRRP